MYQVLFYSRGGNTKKLADAIADEVGAKAESIKSASIDKAAEVVFLGCGCYIGKPAQDMSKFIASGNFQGLKVALFGTSGSGQGKEVTGMAEALRQKGALVLDSYYCRGPAFPLFRKVHPDRGELDGVKRFASKVINNK